jgi:hypothetical protein
MTSQENIERNIRLVIGDLHVQLVLARTQIEELEHQLRQLDAAKNEPELPLAKGNGTREPKSAS